MLNKNDFLLDALHVTTGSFLYTAGIYCFTAPNKIAPGGVSGISTMINALTGIPMGILTFAFNVPLLLLAFFFVSKHFAYKTLVTTTLISLFLDLVLVHFPVYQGDMILGAVFGGASWVPDLVLFSCGISLPEAAISLQNWYR